uniref:Uncharacterized protein n=1 Tax=Avena sativa TaxID=4498 RepID=A0ACD5UIT8_AVESA
MQFLTASAASSSSSAPPLPRSAHLLRVSRPPPFPHLRRRRAPHLPSLSLSLAPRPPLLLASHRSLLLTPRAHGDHHHHHNHGHSHGHSHGHGHHGHGHGHGHGHDGAEVHGGGGGAAVMRVARAIGWADVADALREHLQVCCISLGLLLMAAVCPHVAPLSSVGRLPAALIAVAFPLVGVSAALDALVDIADGKINIHVLMALAAFASIFMGNSLEGGLLLAMFNLAHIAEEYFTSKSMYDVRELKENHPEFALLLETSGDESVQFSNLSYTKVPVHDLEVDSHILVRAGEAVPVDGEVYQGSSTITIEHLTGETKPVERTVGDAIPGGARNLEGMMIVKVTKSWEDSTLNRIVQLTEEGQLNKPKLQRWLDEFGEHYSKVVVALSLAVALLGPFLFKWPFFGNSVCRGSIYRGLGLMVAASPCALAVAPLAYATAISSLASKGILLKGGHVLDALSACQSIAFDKTGTLTTGKLMCKAIEPIHGHLDVSHGVNDPSCCTPNCESEALAVAAAMEKGTTHPIGRAVLNHSVGRDLPVVGVESFESLPGRGVVATLSGIKARDSENELAKASIGSVEYISSLYISNGESEQIKQAVKCSAFGPEFVQAALSVDKKVTLFHFEDEPRPGVCEVKQSVALALTCIVFAALPSVLGFLPLWLTVLLHEGGTLLVCLNSIRALNPPTWSWGDDLRQLIDGLRNYISNKLNSSSSKFSAKTAPL